MPAMPGRFEHEEEEALCGGVSDRPPGATREPSDSGATVSSSLATSSGRLSSPVPAAIAPPSQHMLAVHRCRLIDWSPSAVAALAPSLDGRELAVARESGQIELWSSAAGSVGWHCRITIPGRKEACISSLVWCRGPTPRGRLFSAGLDGQLTEWDLCTLRAKATVDSLGGPVWGMAAEPALDLEATVERKRVRRADNGEKGDFNDDERDNAGEGGEGDEDDDDDEGSKSRVQRIAVGCDDGRVRLFTVEDGVPGMVFDRALPPVTGRVLSVAWDTRRKKLFAGGADGCIRCWDVASRREMYRITVGVGSTKKENICVWSLLSLRGGTLVSGDSSGSTQFWDDEMGVLLHSHKRHQADVLALAAAPSNTAVFAAGIDGQVIMYQEVTKQLSAQELKWKKHEDSKSWVYVGTRRSHTHDVRALVSFVVPDSVGGDGGQDDGGVSRHDRKRKLSAGVQKGAAMLMSGGNDAELLIYPANAFLSFAPFSICPAPEPPIMQLSAGAERMRQPTLISQHKEWIDLWELEGRSTLQRESVEISMQSASVSPRSVGDDRSDMDNAGSDREMGMTVLARNGVDGVMGGEEIVEGVEQSGRNGGGEVSGQRPRNSSAVPPKLVARIKCRGVDHIVCSALSPDGRHVVFSDRVQLRLFRLEKRRPEGGGLCDQALTVISRCKLPKSLPPAHRVVFSADSTRFILAACNGSILVVDVREPSVSHAFSRPELQAGAVSDLSPATLLHASNDGQWIAAADATGRINLYNLETMRHHWSMKSPDSAQITAMVFHPGSGALIIATSVNRIHVFDVEARCLAEWSRKNLGMIPRRLLEMPGGITGLSMSRNHRSTTLIAYNSRCMCLIDLSKPIPGTKTSRGDDLGKDGVVVVDRKGHGSPSWEGRMGTAREGTLKEEEQTAIVRKLYSETTAQGNGCQNLGSDDRNFMVLPMKHRCLFLGHIGEGSLFLVEKPWVDVLAKFPAPLYRHKYGT